MRDRIRLFYLGTLVLCLVLVSMCNILPVQAVHLPSERENFSWTFNTDSTGHTYIYTNDLMWSLFSPQYLSYPEDIRVTEYSYRRTSWSRTQTVYLGPSISSVNIGTNRRVSWDWLCPSNPEPKFIDIANLTNIASPIKMSMNRSVFPISIGTPQAVVVETTVPYIGTFNLTNEEFCHITVSSAQDECHIGVSVFGPGGVCLNGIELNDGMSGVIPIKPIGAGMYTVFITATADDYSGPIFVNLLVQPVTPDVIDVGELVEGSLTGSKLWLDPSSNSVYYKETPPTARTYRLVASSDSLHRISYSLNLPELALYPMYGPYVVMTSNTFTSGYYGLQQYIEWTDNLYGHFYYMSFEGESYYITMIGMDNTGYTLYNEESNDELPVNRDFRVFSPSSDLSRGYRLVLDRDSILIVNGTITSGGVTWSIFRVLDNNWRVSKSLPVGSSLPTTTPIYLPAGKYVVMGGSADPTLAYYRFTLGPVLDTTGPVSVDLGGVVGLKAPVSPTSSYLFNFTLTTQDNITVATKYAVIDSSGLITNSGSFSLGNRQNGGQWQAYTQNTTYFVRSPIFNQGNCVIVVYPLSVQNNTLGLPGPTYPRYTVDYLVSYQFYPGYTKQTASISIDALSVSHDFKLVLPGTSTELYGLLISCSSRSWLTVHILTADVSTWSATAYQSVNGKLQYQPWTSLDDTFSGNYVDGRFQFGSIGDEMLLLFTLTRQLSSTGYLNITITQHITNVIDPVPPVMYRGAGGGGIDILGWLAQNWPIVGAGVAVVAIVTVVVYKKRSS